MSEQPTILISGGAGYIGSHTALALSQNGFKPVVIDSLVTGHRWAAKFGPFRQGDVGDADFVRAVCEEFNPSALIHFAAFIEVGESMDNPEKYRINNTVKATKLFDTVLESGVKNVVFSSTAAVYGAVKSDKPITETLETAPVNPYGQSKLNTEKYLRGLGKAGMNSVILRYFNASGDAPLEHGIGEAHWPESHLIPNAILAAGVVRDKKLSLFGTDYPTPDGTCVRDYIHVLDLAGAHVQAMRYLFDGGKSEICNLGTGNGYSVRQIIDAVQSTGLKVNVETSPRRKGDPPFLVADSTKAKQVLNWEPTRGLKKIVGSAGAWHTSPRYLEHLRQKAAPAFA